MLALSSWIDDTCPHRKMTSIGFPVFVAEAEGWTLGSTAAEVARRRISEDRSGAPQLSDEELIQIWQSTPQQDNLRPFDEMVLAEIERRNLDL